MKLTTTLPTIRAMGVTRVILERLARQEKRKLSDYIRGVLEKHAEEEAKNDEAK